MDKDPDKPTLNRLLKYISPDVPTIAVAVGALLVSSGANIALPSILGKILDSSSKAPQNPQQNPIFNDPTFKNSIFKALGVFAVGALSSWLRVYCFSIAQERIASRLRGDLFEALLKRKQEQIDIDPEHSTGAVLHVLDEDVVIAAEVFTENLAVGLRALNSSVNGSILLLSISPKLTLVSLAVVPFVGAGAMMFSRFVQQETKKLHHAQNKAFSFASERISQSRMVSLFHREAFEAHQFRQKLGDVFAVSQKVAVAEGRFRGALTMGLNVSALAVLFYGGTLVSQGELTLGKLTSFVMYSGMVGLGFSSIAAFTSSMSKALSSAARVFRHIDAADSKGISSFFPASRCSGHIKFENVTFSYPSRKDSVALKNISFELLPGQILGIAGSSGSGKTTITSLLARIYDLDAPRQGDILIDGMSIFDLDSSWIRDQIGVVEQGAALLSGTILDNIRYGDLSASNEQVVNAAKAANAHDFITCFPEGYLTQVGELGGQLSGGQVQRIAIARAFLKNPPILILDEATSALDAKNEEAVQEAIQHLMKGRSVLLISHKPSSLQLAQRLIIIKEGEKVAEGSFEELKTEHFNLGLDSDLTAPRSRHLEIHGRYSSPSSRHAEAEDSSLVELKALIVSEFNDSSPLQ